MLVCVHGWGMDAGLLAGLAAQLGGAVCADLGYADANPDARLPPADGERLIGIGHSFGALWLLRHVPRRLAGLVVVNGFARLTRAPGWPDGLPPRVLGRMRSRFAEQPCAVLDEFRAGIGLPPWRGPMNAPALERDLTALAEWDGREALQALQALGVPVLCLDAADDPLLPPGLGAATAQLAGASHRLHPRGGHLLPLREPAWCAQAIREWRGG